MANLFEITTTAETVTAEVNGEARAKVIYTVTNKTGRPLRGIARIQVLKQTQEAWVSLEGDPEKEFPPGGTQQFVINFSKPLAPVEEKKTEPEEKYPFRLNVASAARPDEDVDEGQEVTVVKPVRQGKVPPGGFPWWILIVIGAIVLIGAIVGIIIGVRSCNPSPGPGPGTPTPEGQVAVPPVVDLQFNLASQKLKDAKLVAKRVDEIVENGNPNQVLKQNPEAGTMVAAGSPVSLTTVAAVRVPRLTGSSFVEAFNALRAAGLEVGNVTGEANTASGALIDIISQSPSENVEVPKGSKVNIGFKCIRCTVTTTAIRKEVKDAVIDVQKFRMPKEGEKPPQ